MAGLPCCPAPPGEGQAYAAEAQWLKEAAADPTLDSCCQRDLSEQAEVARLRAALTRCDPTGERQRLAARVIRAGGPGELRSESEGEEAEDVDVLARLRALRLQQLQRTAAAKAGLQGSGHGALTTLPERTLAKELRGSDSAPVVCHLALEGVAAGQELDECLEQLAHSYLGTRFLRVLLRPQSTLHLRLGVPPQPGLAAFREGAVVGWAPLERFGGVEGLEEEAVNAWLRRQQVLQTMEELLQRAPGSTATGTTPKQQQGGSSDEEEDAEAEGGEWQDPCELCGRRYAHTHVRAVYAARTSDSEEEDG